MFANPWEETVPVGLNGGRFVSLSEGGFDFMSGFWDIC